MIRTVLSYLRALLSGPWFARTELRRPRLQRPLLCVEGLELRVMMDATNPVMPPVFPQDPATGGIIALAQDSTVNGNTTPANGTGTSDSLATSLSPSAVAYGVYLARVSDADQLYHSAIATASTNRQAALDTAFSSPQAAVDTAYASYQNAAQSAYAAYTSRAAAAQTAYESTLDAAAGIYAAAILAATDASQAAADSAGAAYDAAVTPAKSAYDSTVAAANAAFDQAVNPAQADLDAAWEAYNANPADPAATTALEAAQASFGSTVDTASAAWSATVTTARSDLDGAVAAATAAWSAAQQAAQATFGSAMADAAVAWSASCTDAWNTNVLSEAAAWSSFQATEADAWAMYQGAATGATANLASAQTGAQSDFDIAVAAALTNWQITEGAAWADYQTALAADPSASTYGPRAAMPLDPGATPPLPSTLALNIPERRQGLELYPRAVPILDDPVEVMAIRAMLLNARGDAISILYGFDRQLKNMMDAQTAQMARGRFMSALGVTLGWSDATQANFRLAMSHLLTTDGDLDQARGDLRNQIVLIVTGRAPDVFSIFSGAYWKYSGLILYYETVQFLEFREMDAVIGAGDKEALKKSMEMIPVDKNPLFKKPPL